MDLYEATRKLRNHMQHLGEPEYLDDPDEFGRIIDCEGDISFKVDPPVRVHYLKEVLSQLEDYFNAVHNHLECQRLRREFWTKIIWNPVRLWKHLRYKLDHRYRQKMLVGLIKTTLADLPKQEFEAQWENQDFSVINKWFKKGDRDD